jgi:competence protein ComEC
MTKLQNLIKEKRIHKYIRYNIILPLIVSFSAAISTAPILLYYFFRLPLLTVFANLIIVPLVGIATPLGFLVVLMNLLSHGLAGIFANALWLCSKLIILISSWFSNISFAVIEPGRPPVLLVFIFYLAVLFILFWRNIKFRKMSLAIILVGLNLYIWHSTLQSRHLSITFLDIKQGDAIFFDLPNGRKIMIDAGEENEIVSQFLKSKGIKDIDLAVITHPHLDHYGGYRNILDKINIKNLLVATDAYKDTLYTNLIFNIKNKGTKVILAERGQIINGLGIIAEVLLPDASVRRIYNMNVFNPNDLSVVVKIEYANKTLLFPGDLDDAEFLNNQNIQADILKSPHHGSKKANSILLLNQVRPNFIIITGRKKINRNVIKLIGQYQIIPFNTRKDGGLNIELKPNQTIFNQINNKKLIFSEIHTRN